MPVPSPHPLAAWRLGYATTSAPQCPLSPTAARPVKGLAREPASSLLVLSGPEGGLSPAEEQAAVEKGFEAVQLGPRILRADTAPLALLAWLALA